MPSSALTRYLDPDVLARVADRQFEPRSLVLGNGALHLPSTPELHTAGAEVRLAERVRKAGAAGIRIESLLRADGGGLETLVVFAPRRGKRRAGRRRGRSDTVRA